ncbi:3-ketoacyl- thiolase 2, peroxisomal [Olea europaea subsp. europaea]|uniref:acetyl-CoA C-acyltransferase n=1 Tax=Olea europaea subsp. europaea TaxID=158383 RepID=A0A8S0TJS4_OLEEU|nr:3-ketoacyl- thiolase 2, peroxisomal [Olea europaea subsp. europaea]
MDKAIDRQRILLQHLRPSFTSSSVEDIESSISASICSAGDSAAYHRASVFGDDVVIVAAYRTALCKSKRGGFKDTYPDDLLAPVLRALIEKTNLNPSEVGDIVVGTVMAPGSQRAGECRMAAFYAGFPETVPVRTVNRQCSSGLQAVADVAAAIKAGFYDIGIGAGLESMTVNPMAWQGSVNPKVKTMAQAQDCLLPMGTTSENVASRFGVTRQEQDQAAVESHRKAAAATVSGKFKDEIIPVKTKIVDPKTGDEKPVTISVDDGIRPNASIADLGRLKPVFKKDGTTTAGNSSQVSDGAGAVLLMKRSVAMQKGMPVLGIFRSFAAVGVDPAIMGVGPAVAIPAAVKSAGLELDDIDLFEINEAFASQFVYCRKKLELDPEKINVNGGAMAIGHPLGATGARCVATLLHEMKRRGRDYRFGVVSMCIAGDSAAYHRASVFGDDVVIVAAYRTALCKSKRGGFKDTYPDDLLAPVLRALIEKTNLNPSEVGDIVVGTVMAPGSQRAGECRMAAFYAGFPETVPVRTVNRQCSSGLQAVADVAAAIKAGFYDIGIGAGLESMTVNPMAWQGSVNPKVKTMAQAQDCLLPMGTTSENVASRFGVTRQEQDRAAVESHRKAAAATVSGKFKDEIIPVKTKIVDPKTGDEKPVTISVDDGIRPNASIADLGKLKPVFKKDGTTTAGNSSQVSDGAGAVLLMKRSVAMQKGMPILGIFRSFAAVGVDPAIMGVGPAVAIPAAVKSAGLELDDIDLFEINEAFASQFVYCRKKLELDPEKINVNGGAMAIGHPLGATGARCVATLLHEMKRRGRDYRFGVVSMCIGTGMGAAAVFERGDSCDELRNARQIDTHNFLSKDAR